MWAVCVGCVCDGGGVGVCVCVWKWSCLTSVSLTHSVPYICDYIISDQLAANTEVHSDSGDSVAKQQEMMQSNNNNRGMALFCNFFKFV